MYIPIALNEGLVMLYNIQPRSSINNIKAPDGFNWGSIYQISPLGIYNAMVGQSVLFSGRDIVCRLAVSSVQYPVIEEAKIVTTETESLA